MSNLAALLKDEIRRLSRREVRAQVRVTQRAVAQHRREIAQLKRALQLQQKQIAALGKREAKPERNQDASDHALAGTRFSARSVRAQRKRLKLSADEYGKLVGVSAQTIYHWEQGKARPRQAQFTALIALRTIGRREALARLK
jgi:DNA-binding transcriptional regulator YiaG